VIGIPRRQLPIWFRGASCAAPMLVLSVISAEMLHGQETLSSLTGAVRNESGRSVEQAQIVLDPGAGQREVRSDKDGWFSFLGVSPGTHRLRVLRIGFEPRDTSVLVAGPRTEVEISLQRLTRLSEVTIRARPSGVYGTVLARDSLKPLEGARVELLGARTRDTTGHDGSFAMPSARPGTWMLRVTRDGYDTRLLSVRVPKDTGVAIDLVLTPGSPLLDNHMEMLWADLEQRLNWAGVNASFTGRDELVGHGESLDLALKFAFSFSRKGIVIDDRACLFVNGVGRPGYTIKDFSVDEVESIEVYARGGEYTGNLELRWPPKVVCGDPTAVPIKGNRAMAIVIWTRR
jgi:hypothetical protein